MGSYGDEWQQGSTWDAWWHTGGSAGGGWNAWHDGYRAGWSAATWAAARGQQEARQQEPRQQEGRAQQRDALDHSGGPAEGPRVCPETRQEIRAYAQRNDLSIREAERVLIGLDRRPGGRGGQAAPQRRLSPASPRHRRRSPHHGRRPHRPPVRAASPPRRMWRRTVRAPSTEEEEVEEEPYVPEEDALAAARPKATGGAPRQGVAAALSEATEALASALEGAMSKAAKPPPGKAAGPQKKAEPQLEEDSIDGFALPVPPAPQEQPPGSPTSPADVPYIPPEALAAGPPGKEEEKQEEPETPWLCPQHPGPVACKVESEADFD